MALWVFKRYEALEEYSEWESGYSDAGYNSYSPDDYISGFTSEPEWMEDKYYHAGGHYYGPIKDAPSNLYDGPTNYNTRCEYTKYYIFEEVDEFLNPTGFWGMGGTEFYYERDFLGYTKGWYIDEVTAEYGTYPGDGEQDGYWWEAIGPAWTAPDLKMNINGALKSYKDGWVKVDGALKRINKMWAKINGVLREI